MCTWTGSSTSVEPARVTKVVVQSDIVRVSVPCLMTAYSVPSWWCQPVLPPGCTVISRSVESVPPAVHCARIVAVTPRDGVASATPGATRPNTTATTTANLRISLPRTDDAVLVGALRAAARTSGAGDKCGTRSVPRESYARYSSVHADDLADDQDPRLGRGHLRGAHRPAWVRPVARPVGGLPGHGRHHTGPGPGRHGVRGSEPPRRAAWRGDRAAGAGTRRLPPADDPAAAVLRRDRDRRELLGHARRRERGSRTCRRTHAATRGEAVRPADPCPLPQGERAHGPRTEGLRRDAITPDRSASPAFTPSESRVQTWRVADSCTRRPVPAYEDPNGHASTCTKPQLGVHERGTRCVRTRDSRGGYSTTLRMKSTIAPRPSPIQFRTVCTPSPSWVGWAIRV